MTRETQKESHTEEQDTEPPSQLPQQEEDVSRKLYVTKAGEKYHLKSSCDTLRGRRSYERKACEACKEQSQRILTLNPNGRQAQSASQLGFINDNEEYHHEERQRWKSHRRKGKRPICLACENEELTLLWARNRTPTGRTQSNS